MVAQMPSGASEIPGMAGSRLNRSTAFGTNWSSGGVRRSTDYGATWSQVDATASAWGIDIAKDDPGVVIFGRYSGSGTLVSTNGGTNWSSVTVPMGWGNNYGMYARDRATMLCHNSSGIWKLQATYPYAGGAQSQSMALLAPNNGEVLGPGSVFKVRWSQNQVVLARIEYRNGPSDPWHFVADVRGYNGEYSWTIPFDGTSTAQVRVSDAWDGAPSAISSGTFTIQAPRLASSPEDLDYGQQVGGSSTPLSVTIQNQGTDVLAVWTATTTTAAFHPGRGDVTIAAGQQDTIGVWFEPTADGAYVDTLTLTTNDQNHATVKVPLTGTASTPTLAIVTPAGGEAWQYNSVNVITWTGSGVSSVDLDYRVSPDSAWVPIATGLPPLPASYDWTVPYAPTFTAQVRIRGTGPGSPQDESNGFFEISSPLFYSSADTVWLPIILVGGTASDTLRIENHGYAPLDISAISVSNPDFWVGRTSLTIDAFSSDTIGVYYSPLAEGADTVVVTFTTDAPFPPHQRVVTAQASATTAADPSSLRGASFALQQSLPNPFRGHTTIRYSLPMATDVTLEVFDLRGNRVATLVKGREDAGAHSVRFGLGAHTVDGAPLQSLRSGVYFYRLHAAGRESTRKMLLIQ
jgi:hypothetical protein